MTSLKVRFFLALLGALAIAVASGYWQLQKPKMYSAVATVQFEKPNAVVVTPGGLDPAIRTDFDLNTTLQVMMSIRVREMVSSSFTPAEQQIILRPFLKSLPPGGNPPPIGAALGSLSVDPVRNTFLVRVSDTSQDPEAAAIIANRFVEKFMDYAMDKQSAENLYAATYLKDRSEGLRKEYEAAEVRLRESRAGADRPGEVEARRAAAQAAEQSLEVQVSVAKDNYREMLSRLAQINTTAGVGRIPFRMLDAAVPNYAPIRPVISWVVESCFRLGIILFAVGFIVLTGIDFWRRHRTHLQVSN